MIDLNQLKAYQFDLPKELIAQCPAAKRDLSRLLVIDRQSGRIQHRFFHEMTEILPTRSQLVLNDTKVIPARLKGKRESGSSVEIFLLKKLPDETWEALAKPGRKLKIGDTVLFGKDFSCKILKTSQDGRKCIRFDHEGSFEPLLEKYGATPLPQYIRREAVKEVDNSSYQTIYAKHPGAVAAPTAGLHFTHELFQKLEQQGIDRTYLTLHVGLGTFRPVQVEDIRRHRMHAEHAIISPETAKALNAKKTVCVGTTCCRALESVASDEGVIQSGEFDTDIFIYPGYKFKYVEALLTNFHLPGSTLLMLVSAFAGYELTMKAYEEAVKEKYRFFSYGDAMLIL